MLMEEIIKRTIIWDREYARRVESGYSKSSQSLIKEENEHIRDLIDNYIKKGQRKKRSLNINL